ncbi:MAG: phage tail protein [Myxococcales bacterium]|nr:phage tail protein [Myxococcota bacterium]MDW8282662.1 phage tail protein [Myxococcales bacterium]
MAMEQERRLVQVPDVIGMPLRKALLLMKQAGLTVDSVLYKESYEDKDTVLEQRPPRRQMVYAGTNVVLTVSRESYIKWLPALYQRSDVTGKNFVRDLLWIVQHMFGSIEERLDVIHTYFDPYEAPEEFLPWLAGWSAMVLEPDWPVAHKRRLIRNAMELYRLRGTVRGLSLFIKLFTGFEPILRENEWPFPGFRIGVTSTIGVNSVILPPVDKSRAFVVVMPHRFRDLDPQSIIRLLEIIELEKPAHTTYMLKFEEPPEAVEEREFYRIGVRSGINIGDEIVTPLPINEETGEPEYPKERVEPPTPPDPSVYELFATRKREMPVLKDVPRADNAPVEGREVVSTKFGFEGVMEFRLEDIMRELLEAEQGKGSAVEGEGGQGDADLAAGVQEGDVPSAAAMQIDYGTGSHSGARAPHIVLEHEEPDDAVDAGAHAPATQGADEGTAAPPLISTEVDYGHVRAAGKRPVVEVEVERPVDHGEDGAEDEDPDSGG